MKCDRCGKETICWKKSWFNLDDICMGCAEEEESHPEFKKAKEAVYAEEAKGNRDYEGIGWSK